MSVGGRTLSGDTTVLVDALAGVTEYGQPMTGSRLIVGDIDGRIDGGLSLQLAGILASQRQRGFVSVTFGFMLGPGTWR